MDKATAVAEWRTKHPERYKAHREISNALRRGDIHRPKNCQRCNVSCIPHGHHADYSKPLEVEWLCGACHRAEHGYAHLEGRRVHSHPGEKNAAARLTADSVKEIRTLLAGGERPDDIAKLYGVSGGAIRFIRAGKTWKSV